MMRDEQIRAFAYLRLSREELQDGESGSITNQRRIISDYCRQNRITLLREFVDDGWSGGNFDRPAFNELLKALERGAANIVITKDLSRLGRDMRESSYYAEQYFPELGIRYIAISDNFDTDNENIMAPFQFAMNEVYLRDGSRKVREVLKNKRENGLYCACPPYGYRKAEKNNNLLVPDEMTAPIVRRIFEYAARGDSSRRIAKVLSDEGVIPPLKYRVLYRDAFGSEGTQRVSDIWNYTTVKRILKNPVYLGHTALGKSRKLSVKSKKKVKLPSEEWAVTENTHEPIVSRELYERAQMNLGRGSRENAANERVRKSIFGGIAFCGICGHALCSAGTVYKGEREKYWYLVCTHKRRDISKPCEGVRIKYADLIEIVRCELNALISMEDTEISALVREVLDSSGKASDEPEKRLVIERTEARLSTISRMITKLYTDNAEGRLEDSRLFSMVSELEGEAKGLNATLKELKSSESPENVEDNYARFFELARGYTRLEQLDREALQTFVERIEVGPKESVAQADENGNKSVQYRQSIRIFYKFIGELGGRIDKVEGE